MTTLFHPVLIVLVLIIIAAAAPYLLRIHDINSRFRDLTRNKGVSR